MELLLICGGCRARLRISHPERARRRSCPRCGQALLAAEDSVAAAPPVGLESPPVIQSQDRRADQRWLAATACTMVIAFVGAVLVARAARPGAPPDFNASSPFVLHPSSEFALPPVPDRTPTLTELASASESELESGETPYRPGESAASDDGGPTTLPRADTPPPLPRPASKPPSQKANGPVPRKPAPSSLLPARDAPPPPPAPAPKLPEAQRVKIAGEGGDPVVARVHGGPGSDVALMPDGRLVFFQGTVFTDAPFQPETADEMRVRLLGTADLHGFHVEQTEHYLVFSQGARPDNKRFADLCANHLESLYRGLLTSLSKKGFDVHESEFPLVAIIYRTEAEFRAKTQVDPEVQAFYENLSNRIVFFEKSTNEADAPDVAALRKPQTVAHEGTHQILQNIGLQPRLAPWPPWLIEGMAEFCAPTSTKKNAEWKGFSQINPFHMATFHDLREQGGVQVYGKQRGAPQFALGNRWIEELVVRGKLQPIDYALSWALTYYLANKRTPEFVSYLKTMSKLPPLQKLSPDDHLRMFRKAFLSDPKLAGADPKAAGTDRIVAMGRLVERFLDAQKNFQPIPYYAVGFIQQMPGGIIRRASVVSPSPATIRQWIEGITDPNGGPSRWEAHRFRTRTEAEVAAQQWMNNS
jgi:hypothetical protein